MEIIEIELAKLKDIDCHIYDEDTPREKRLKDMHFGKIVGTENILELLKTILEVNKNRQT